MSNFSKTFGKVLPQKDTTNQVASLIVGGAPNSIVQYKAQQDKKKANAAAIDAANRAKMRAEALAEAQRRRAAANSQADAERLQAEGNKAEFDRQAEAERLRSEKSAGELTLLGEGLRNAKLALAAQSGFKATDYNVLDVLNKTKDYQQKNMDAITSASQSKQDIFKQLGMFDLQTALETGTLRNKGAADIADFLGTKGQGDIGYNELVTSRESALGALQAKKATERTALNDKLAAADKTIASIGQGDLFTQEKDFLTSYAEYKKQNPDNNFIRQKDSIYSPYGVY